MDKIVVTGMGIVSGVGQDIPSFTKALRDGTSAFTIKNDYILSEVKDFSLKDWQKILRKTSLPIQSSVGAVAEALKMAQNPKEMSLVVGGNNTTTNFLYESFQKYEKEPMYLSPTYAMQFMDTFQLGIISEIFGIHGEGFTVGGASASGNTAIIQGCRLIQQGLADVCVVVGVLADLSPVDIMGFVNVGALGGKNFKDHPEKACRPFDKEHEGFIYGQASACVILESAESARKRGVKALAAITGMANQLQGSSRTEPSEEAEINVMKKAIEASGRDIQYINAHGSSSPLGDDIEASAIKKLFGDSVWVNATKGITGHCLWSAGVVELIATILQMQGKFLHPNLNLENPVDNLKFVPNKAIDADIQVALSNSFGFGGINTCLVIESYL